MQNFHSKLNLETKINLAMSYENNDIITKFCSEYEINEEVGKEYFMEIKKFLFLCSNTNKTLAPSSEIDKIWHTFILFTKEYRLYCINFLGKFIDHVPEVNKSELPPEENFLENTINSYLEIFGELNNDVWQIKMKKEHDCSSCNNCSCDYTPECSRCESREHSCVFTGNCFNCSDSGQSCVGENPNNL